MNSIKANNFKTRDELENHVRGLLGLTPEIKSNYEISGSVDELKRLQLSSDCLFWGIKVVASDESKPIKAKVQEKVFRGEQFDYGINIKNNKKK